MQLSYAVFVRMAKVWDHGDGSPQRRLIIVAVKKSTQGADDYELPEPVYTAKTPHTARDTAVPDELVSMDHWRKETLKIFRPKEDPKPGVMQKIGRLKPNMGHSTNPHLAIQQRSHNVWWRWHQAINRPTVGSGSLVCVSVVAAAHHGHRVLHECVSVTMPYTMQTFHTTFCPTGSDLTHFLRDCVNQG